MSLHSTDAFRHATELVGTEIWSFCQQFYFAERRELSWSSCWKSHHENAEENSTAYERLTAVYRFLHALKYQHINYTLERYLLRCFYPRIRNFRKKFWKRRERLFQKNVCPDTKAAYYFSKTRQKNFCKIALANATCFQ